MRASESVVMPTTMDVKYITRDTAVTIHLLYMTVYPINKVLLSTIEYSLRLKVVDFLKT